MACILVVDDDDDSRDALGGVLRKRGHDVSAAPDGREALVLLTGGAPPDLIVLDLRMPGMDGVTFLHVLRSYRRLQRIPVMVLTAYPESLESTGVTALGVLDVFRKPDEFAALVDAVDEHGRGNSSPGGSWTRRHGGAAGGAGNDGFLYSGS